MELVIKIDTTQPLDATRLRAEAQFLLYLADNGTEILSRAPGNPESAFTGNVVVEGTATVAAQVPPPPPGTTAAVTATMPLTAAPTPDAAPAVDATGLPWDERIHSSSKKTNADGTWTSRRGTSPALKAQVEHELRSAMAAGGTTPAAPAAPAQVPGAAINMVPPPPPAASAAQVPPPPPAAAAPAAQVPPPPAGNLLQSLSQAVMTGKVTIDAVMAEIQKYGVTDLGQLAANPLASASVEKTFREQGVI